MPMVPSLFTIADLACGWACVVHALRAMAVVIVPAALMVSTIRFRSFKAIDLHAHRANQWLIAVAALAVAVAGRPREVLIVIAHGYLFSGLTGLAVSRLRPDHLGPTPMVP